MPLTWKTTAADIDTILRSHVSDNYKSNLSTEDMTVISRAAYQILPLIKDDAIHSDMHIMDMDGPRAMANEAIASLERQVMKFDKELNLGLTHDGPLFEEYLGDSEE